MGGPGCPQGWAPRLARQMDQQGLKYRQQGNCFVWVEDDEEAQQPMNQQLEANRAALLNGLAGQSNPLQEDIAEQYPASYYWTCYESEWATEIVFGEADFLKRLMPLLVRHGMLGFSSPDVMRYFRRRVNRSGSGRGAPVRHSSPIADPAPKAFVRHQPKVPHAPGTWADSNGVPYPPLPRHWGRASDTPGCSHHHTNQRSSTESDAASGMTTTVAPRKDTEIQ